MENIGQHVAYDVVIVSLTKPPQLQEETLHPAPVGWVLTLPSMTLLLGHCMLGHDADNEAGVQYKLTTENRDNGPKFNSAVNQRTTEKNEMILAKIYLRLPGPQLHCTQLPAVRAQVPFATINPWSEADFGNADAHADAETNNHRQKNVGKD